jgi:uncharacterized protein YndB with AHSA1/START domain
MSTDRIEKQIHVRAPRERVWNALVDSKQFAHWFGVTLDGPFVVGRSVTGKNSGSRTNPEVAKMQMEHAGKPFEIWIEKIEPQKLFSFRWHPHAVDTNVDYSNEPTTLVSFELTEQDGGILITVTESGFDQIPLARRAEAFTGNEGGWSIMIQVLGEHVGHGPS